MMMDVNTWSPCSENELAPEGNRLAPPHSLCSRENNQPRGGGEIAPESTQTYCGRFRRRARLGANPLYSPG